MSIIRFAIISALVVIAIATARHAEAQDYLDASDWSAALPSEPIEITPFPTYTAVTSDAFGTPGHPGLIGSSGADSGGSGGSLTGSFGCYSPVYPCEGVVSITYTLPFQIVGFEGSRIPSFLVDGV